MKNLPNVIVDLIKAQENLNSTAYANCFTATAIVFDEGKIHKGQKEIKQWIEKANKDYQVVMKPLVYFDTDQTLQAEISGSFPGSPLVLTYQFEIIDHKIQSLKIE